MFLYFLQHDLQHEVSIVGNIAWITVACPGFYGVTEPISEMGLWMTCIFSTFASICFAKKSQNTVAAIIGGVLGVTYLGFNIAGWAIKGIECNVMGLVNQIFLSIQAIGRFLMIPALIKVTDYVTMLIEVLLDAFCIDCSIVALILEVSNEDEMSDISLPNFAWVTA